MAKAIENTFHGDQEVELVDLPCRSPSTTASQSSNSPPSDDGTDSSSETVVEEEQPVANHDASHTTPRIFDRLAKLRSNGRSILKTATFSVTAFTGIFGLGYYSYRADVLARWTATKEFWILCRDLEVSLTQ